MRERSPLSSHIVACHSLTVILAVSSRFRDFSVMTSTVSFLLVTLRFHPWFGHFVGMLLPDVGHLHIEHSDKEGVRKPTPFMNRRKQTVELLIDVNSTYMSSSSSSSSTASHIGASP